MCLSKWHSKKKGCVTLSFQQKHSLFRISKNQLTAFVKVFFSQFLNWAKSLANAPQVNRDSH